MSDLTLVTGAGGFIGGQLVRRLVESNVSVRAVDARPFERWLVKVSQADNRVADLRRKELCDDACRGVRFVYNLAADMGGIGFIEHNKASCMLSVLINTHMLTAAHTNGVERFFFASSACVYAAAKQQSSDVAPLKESDAYPADAEDGYGWEKLFSERMCRHFMEDFGLETRVARYHNIYGPFGTWDGGREKAPAAIARKVAIAMLAGQRHIEIWGDGKQTRSFTYIDDCLQGTRLLMESDVRTPLNIGSDELVTVDQLVDAVERVAGIRLERRYDVDAPKGVRGRNSDNTLIRSHLGWSPSTRLDEGMERTFRWIYDQVKARAEGRPYAGGA